MTVTFCAEQLESPSGVPAGLWIPRGDLYGISAGEFASGQAAAVKRDKLINAILQTTYGEISQLSSVLGISLDQGSINGVDNLVSRKTTTVSLSYVANLTSKTIGPIPLASSGTNAGTGKLAVKDIFPNAEIVVADDDIPGEGVVIAYTDLSPLGGPATLTNISTGQDNRDFIAALLRYIYSYAVVRATGVVSAVYSKTKGVISRYALNTADYSGENPLTGLTVASLNYSDIYTQPFSFTIETKTDEQQQTTEVNVV